ncbi:MAG: nucleotidyltransferase domain-containing protein [Endomicrobium sp.]|jgi:predicted nucleotidyltransferase|nr:nucleotidyltransferase domain-containing protein [Endomicrobium sp.]
MGIDGVLNQLVEKLKAADPYKIVLFGSYARGTAMPDSDIDLMVVLDNNDIAKTYTERLEKRLHIDRLVRDIHYKYSMDILVYSKAELKKVKDYGNFFVDEINKTGKVIYGKYS